MPSGLTLELDPLAALRLRRDPPICLRSQVQLSLELW